MRARRPEQQDDAETERGLDEFRVFFFFVELRKGSVEWERGLREGQTKAVEEDEEGREGERVIVHAMAKTLCFFLWLPVISTDLVTVVDLEISFHCF